MGETISGNVLEKHYLKQFYGTVMCHCSVKLDVTFGDLIFEGSFYKILNFPPKIINFKGNFSQFLYNIFWFLLVSIRVLKIFY